MISFKKGNLLEDESEALVNTVNCVGVMGKGIALQFKKAFPENFAAYKKACDKKLVVTGKMFIFKHEDMFFQKWIINFPTKKHWKGKSKIEDIDSGLKDLVKQIKKLKIKSIAIPPLGAGLGGLDWEVVKSKIVSAFSNHQNILVNIYEPLGSPNSKKMPIRTKKPNMTRGRAVLLKLLQIYSYQGYEHSKLEVQKLAYLLQESGLNLRLKYKPHNFGPYADNLNHVLNAIDGHYIKGFGDRISKSEITLMPKAVEEADRFLDNDEEAINHLKKVRKLIEGYETPLSLEVLSTVHWSAKRLQYEHINCEVVKREVFNWNERKSRIKDKYIEKAYYKLLKEGWISEGR